MSNANPTNVAHDTTGYSLTNTHRTGSIYKATEPEVDATLCGRDGSLRERRCQLFKLTTLAIVPCIFIIVRDAIKVSSDVQTFQHNRDFQDKIRFSVEIGDVVHTMQLERAATAVYVPFKEDPDARSRLLNSYRDTDAAIENLSKWIAIVSDSYHQTKSSFQRRMSEFRSDLDTRNATLREVINFYTNKNAIFVTMVGLSLNLRRPFNFWLDLASYQNLIISKEHTGVVRAIGSIYFTKAHVEGGMTCMYYNKPILFVLSLFVGPLPDTDHQWYIENRALGTHFLTQSRQYSAFTNSTYVSLLKGTDVLVQIALMQQQIIDNADVAPSVVAGTMWLNNMTEYINILKIVRDRLANNIVQAAAEENSSLLEVMTISAVELAIGIVTVPIFVILVCNIINIIKKIKNFSQDLKEKTCELEAEKHRTEELLYQLLPKTVADQLMKDGSALPESYHSATIMFSDVVGFTAISSSITPMQVVDLLNCLYMTIDTRLIDFDVYKVETSGDGYMVVSGLPNRNGENHVAEIARLSLDLLKTMQEKQMPHLPGKTICLRLGFNSGPVVAGVVGVKMPRYCIFGDTVNTASRMESTGLPSRIQMTETSAAFLRQIGGFIVSERGMMEVKGKGTMRTFWLDGISAQPVPNVSACLDENPTDSPKVTLITVKELHSYNVLVKY